MSHKSSIQVKQSSKKEIHRVINLTFSRIKKQFTKSTIENVAKETLFIQRTSSKITGFDFLVTLLISCTDSSHTSLERMSCILSEVNKKSAITSQAIMKRINKQKTVDFLQSIYSKIINAKLLELEIPSPLLSTFSKILIQDSSTIILHEKLQKDFKGSGGRASSAFAKLDVIYDYKAKQYETIKLTDQREADQRLGLRIENVLIENALVIRDLGYLRVDSLEQIINKKAFFLSRMRSDNLIFLNHDDDKPIDLFTYIEKHCKKGVFDQEVFITAKKLKVRLVAFIAPQEVADKRRREARITAKKQGRNLRESTLKFFGLSIFITNVSSDVWQSEAVAIIYRIRWQIELIFKCWKSRAEIEYLKGTTPERIRCLIFAKLIFILLTQQIYQLAEYIGLNLLNVSVSMPKIFDWMRDSSRLIRIIKGSVKTYEENLFIDNIFKNLSIQKRVRKTTLELVSDINFSNLEKLG